ncbi:MAG TPA: hypothetical protein VD969_00675 [Symbiobacteriaceae bacterium]|nr:hypothetical protein [Symbiobacteriaceae bacterium]
MGNEKTRILKRLQELRTEHAASLGEGPGEAPGFIQDEQITRKSYRVVVNDGLDSGAITEADLEALGLPKTLTEAD